MIIIPDEGVTIILEEREDYDIELTDRMGVVSLIERTSSGLDPQFGEAEGGET